jgi:hypothetical protein
VTLETNVKSLADISAALRPSFIDMTGRQCHDRLVLHYLGKDRWLSRCKCGLESPVRGSKLRKYRYTCKHVPTVRFWAKVEKTDGCWLWRACIDYHGYGQFKLGGLTKLSHVIAWTWENGPVPDGLELDHLCRNALCVRPSHLEAVTHAENVRRGKASATLRQYNKSRRGLPRHPRQSEKARPGSHETK